MMKKVGWLLVFCFIVFLCAGASAATLNLPAALTTIEEEAFAEDTGLDAVVLGNRTQVIASRAFANSSVKRITIPGSVYYIADDAFEGVKGLTVTANEGTYAYSWAVRNEYIQMPEVPTGSETRIVMPEVLQAGANLEIQVFGPANTVSHTVFLINNETNKGTTRLISERNGTAVWEGYDIQDGKYTVKVYTITDNYGAATPVIQSLVVSGTKPKAPEGLKIPDKIGTYSLEIPLEQYNNMMAWYRSFDVDGKVYEEWKEGPFTDHMWLWCYLDASWMTASFAYFQDGLWSEWSNEKEIAIVDEPYNPGWPGLKNITIPENIVAGKDFEISFELDEGIIEYHVALYDKNDKYIHGVYNEYESSASVVFPGYKMEAGEYRLSIDVDAIVDDEYKNYSIFEQTIQINGERKKAEISIQTDKTSVYTNEQINVTIESNGKEGAYFRIINDDTVYRGYALNENGSGTFSTVLDEIYVRRNSSTFTISACVFLGDSWSEWSEPIIVTVSRPEPLPEPVIITEKDNYETGEDIIVSVSNIDESDHYEVYLDEYFSSKTILRKYYEKNVQPNHYGEDVLFSGAQFGSGTYQVRIYAYSSIKGSRTVTKTIKVSGTRAPAPSVVCDPDEFRINQATEFTIDTTDCEEINIKYNDTGVFPRWKDNITIYPTETISKWTYQFYDYMNGIEFSFAFSIKQDGKWSYPQEIRKTVLGLPQLDPAIIHMDETFEAGKEMNFTIESVDNASSYGYEVLSNEGSYIISGSIISPFENNHIEGYRLDPGYYTLSVNAYAEGYKSSKNTVSFQVNGNKSTAPIVSVDKSEFYENEVRPVFTVTAPGAEAIRSSDGYTYLTDEDGTVYISPNMYVFEENERTYYFKFCAVINDAWSEWSEPVSVTIKRAEAPVTVPLDEAVIHLPETILAGQDFTFSFDAAPDATSYDAYISHYYGNSTVYSNYSASPETDMMVSGRLLIPGTYVARVNASANGRTTSSSSVQFKVTGERSAAPEVTKEREVYTVGDTITFSIDTGNAEEVYITYITSGNYGGNSFDWTVLPQQDITEWEYTIPSYFYDTTYRFSFNVKRDGRWSKPKTITISTPAEPVQ